MAVKKFWITEIFDYLNGKVNHNRATSLELVYEPLNPKLGWSGASIVYINYPKVKVLLNTQYGMCRGRYVENPCSTNIVFNMIFDIIVHELSHMDQIIDQDKYNNDSNYKDRIENANMGRSYKWIMNNIDEARGRFPWLDKDYFFRKSRAIANEVEFDKKCKADHLVQMIDRYFQFYVFDNSIISILSNNTHEWLYLKVGDKKYPINNTEECLSIVNGILNSYMYKYNGHKIPAIIEKDNFYENCLNINVQCSPQ